MTTFNIFTGDCLDMMRVMPDNSVDSICTDPPYGLSDHKPAEVLACLTAWIAGETYVPKGKGFMGKKWDAWVPGPEIWREALRVLKPGGHILAFAGTRSMDLMCMSIRIAGFELRDSIGYAHDGGGAPLMAWVTGQGFPKSLNVSADLENRGLTCGCRAEPYAHASKTKHHTRAAPSQGARVECKDGSNPECCVRPLLNSDVSTPQGSGGECGEVLQQSVPQQGAPTQGRPQLSATEVWAGQPCMEGGRDDLQEEGQLQEYPVPQGAGLAEAHGAQGWIPDGASADHGRVVRVSVDENRSCAPRRPQPLEQREAESGVVAGQPKPQAGGAWPICGGCTLPVVPAGLGTALKPSWEPVILARKPLIGTVAANVLEHGTGALNIDGCRVEGRERTDYGLAKSTRSSGNTYGEPSASADFDSSKGRWPANLILDGSDEVVGAFPSAPGALAPVTGNEPSSSTSNAYGKFKRAASDRTGEASAERTYTDKVSTNFAAKPGARRPPEASASRFFYCAKASRKDRNEGLEDPGPQFKQGTTLRDVENAAGDLRGNTHPTVKPTDLMRYLVRLVTPPGGTVMDPYTGSGSTGKACMLEGFNFIGAEMDPGHAEVARARCAHAQAKAGEPAPQAKAKTPKAAPVKAEPAEAIPDTLPLFDEQEAA
jgi:DNA modification methylase